MNEVKQNAIKILYKEFGQHDSIYECADEWASKFKTTAGLVKYYKTYFSGATN
tara:strand:+ start:1419 stop:1577 length:159 start_codon:yes stop_codon:yes gene_type:complete